MNVIRSTMVVIGCLAVSCGSERAQSPPCELPYTSEVRVLERDQLLVNLKALDACLERQGNSDSDVSQESLVRKRMELLQALNQTRSPIRWDGKCASRNPLEHCE